MAAFLSAGNKTILDWIVAYSEESPIDRPADEKLAHELSKLHTALGHTSQLEFREAMRDRPVHTLLKAIQYLNAHA